MEEDCQDVTDLVAVAAKIIEEGKKAEAHARASKAYARKVTKEAHHATATSRKLLKLSSSMLATLLQDIGLDFNNIEIEDLKRCLFLSRFPITYDHLITLLSLRRADEIEDVDLSEEFAHQLKLNAHQSAAAEEILSESNREEDNHDDDTMTDQTNKPLTLSPMTQQEKNMSMETLTVRFSGAITLQTPASGVATKRKSKKRKTNSVSSTSPLISKEDIIICKRSTSPSPSVTSQGYYVPVQHKFTLQHNKSSTSQKTIHSNNTDEEYFPATSDKE